MAPCAATKVRTYTIPQSVATAASTRRHSVALYVAPDAGRQTAILS